jgi:hypothetical protein
MARSEKPPVVPWRNIDCTQYYNCLTQAAYSNASLACTGCPMQHDIGGRLNMNEYNLRDVIGCAMLIHEIFFPSDREE